MAALITQQLNLDTELEPGARGEFSIWVDGKKIAEKTRTGFPTEAEIVEQIKAATKA